CLPAKQLLRLVSEISVRWPKPVEFTIEVNPGELEKEVLKQLRVLGVNRVSIGAQSFRQEELDFLGRGYAAGEIEEAVRKVRQSGFDNISLDLIFAIPGASRKSWKENLDSAIKLRVRHISAYSLSYEEGTGLQKALAGGKILAVDGDLDRAMYEMAIEQLERAGFKHYEISNFAKRGFECLHNLGCWSNRPYIGIGPGASSYLEGTRRTNIADIKKYVEAGHGGNATVESETPDALGRACETAVLNLRRRSGIELKEFKEQTGFDAMELFSKAISRNKQMGLLEIADGRVFLSREALPIADSVLSDFSTI
ncbi:MAG: radical SAM family heme chaperone HemW, partial [Planctomycetota bacterium]